MKRCNHLFEQICRIENLEKADVLAQRGKSKQPGVLRHNANSESNLLKLREMLLTKTFKTSAYTTFNIYEPKERVVYSLPYFPDRIVHHAIMNVLEPIMMAVFTADSYSCIKGKGVHAAALAVKDALKDEAGTQFCLKLDLKQFYPSVDHEALKALLRRKFKDEELLWLLGDVIDSTAGLPIGNYLSQHLANFYLSYFDHWLKEEKKVRYYFRYADDMVFLSVNKEELHCLLVSVKTYLLDNLKLTVKANYQISPVAARSIDFVGYRFYHSHTLLRKGIKKSFARKVANGISVASLASYQGWAKHCNSKNLIKKLIPA